MKRIFSTAAALVILAGTGAAYAQPGHDDHHDMHHDSMSGPGMHGPAHHDWRQGGHIERNDWNRGRQVDYHTHHLRRPPHGYEWREVDGNFVLAAVATGVIASILLANH